MKFGPVPLQEAVGGVCAHSIRLDSGHVLKKGAIVSEADLPPLAAAGITEVTVARLEPGDMAEDEAAGRLARAVAGPGVSVEAPFTGRSNLYAEEAGILVLDRAGIDAVNGVDEAVTFATLPHLRAVSAGEMVGTVKIIPFAVAASAVDKAQAAVAAPLLRVAPYRVKRVGVISTLLPGLADKVIAKTLRVTQGRLDPAGAAIADEARVAHRVEDLAAKLRAFSDAGHELILVFGASAVTDRRDVIPAAIEAAGGTIDHLGMPVDPGNLLLMGTLDGRPVLGAPGCARSPKENGFDWVLQRLLASLPVTRQDIIAMGVGGLLMEIISRPQPRGDQRPAPERAKVAGLILAAGRGTRMGGPNKLLEEVGGKPLVRHAAEAALGARLGPVVVITGHEPARLQGALDGLDLAFVHNPDYAEGLSTSLRVGLGALPADVDAALVLLGDMPRVSADLIRRLVASFDPAQGRDAVVPVRAGHRGNPVLIGRRFFPELMSLTGDVGARGVLGAHGDRVAEVEVAGDAAFLDIDTPEALAAVRGGGG